MRGLGRRGDTGTRRHGEIPIVRIMLLPSPRFVSFVRHYSVCGKLNLLNQRMSPRHRLSLLLNLRLWQYRSHLKNGNDRQEPDEEEQESEKEPNRAEEHREVPDRR